MHELFLLPQHVPVGIKFADGLMGSSAAINIKLLCMTSHTKNLKNEKREGWDAYVILIVY